MLIIACLAVAISICDFVAPTGLRETCSDAVWEKIGGVRPESVGSHSLLFSSVNSNGITKPCFDKCERVNCTAFVVDFARSACYSVETEDDELIPEANSTFYHRVCVKVPVSCKQRRLWQVERNAGAVFIDSGAFHLPRSMTRNQCYEKCIEIGRSCKSAQFRTTKPLSTDDAIGRCTLSLLERGTRPQAYRASMYRDEYLRDQCRNVSKREYCSYAEIRNATLPFSDVALSKLNEKQCERRCDLSVDGFVCRGYTLDNSSGESVCLLHSEDTIGLGVSSLITVANAVYREREPCLDLRVQCNDTIMTVELRTSDAFFGRIYTNGYAETCGVQGHGLNRTILTLPLPRADQLREIMPQCGLNPAFSIDDQNRTRPLVWTTVVVQFNPIVQRLGDQAVRVGCSLNDHEPPEPRNITVHSSFSFLDPNAGVPPISSTIVNASSQAPKVTMRILDENSKDAVVTHVGQKLTVKIQLNPPNGPYDIVAGHLVASSASGDASLLLLNEFGCPGDLATFPPLSKDPHDGRSLITTFNAFKFPGSQLVRFNVVVRFCLDECMPTTCVTGQVSYGRRKRESGLPDASPYDAKVTEVSREITEELPLQLSIIVHSPVASSADRLSSRENGSPDTVFITSGTVAQYRRTAIRAEEDRASVLARHLYGVHGGNFEVVRRVRWADNGSSSSLG
ncbi:uncharacterized protein LOC128890108 isoform X2 [Hylaeus anthracinus]|uniref:uncharacterized protein LOC128875392 isoform X2 n=1 Tax=Hylaeus volcanicus TaxID=313075 RepID=UPI0023B80E99|nr:uncharacterized protein LOC128875392 isoform X2 [Hylaeus volcanicus]XP_054004314.1 uncharacterized protein LOC128890108 isoform X2 [Hylaeus anthracinus]